MAVPQRRQLILHPGAELGGFTIEEVLGMGGMAVVYRATQRSLRRQVALKVLDPRLSEDEGFADRFRREGAHLASLDHPNIVPVHDSGEVDGRLYMAMRLVEGETLADRMRHPGLSAQETVRVLSQVASALDVAHRAGVLHRDVKPQNILMAESGDHVFLADFGVAKGTDSATMTGSGGFLGSVHYASPEQIRGEPMRGTTDLYSLAAVAYECFTGKAPFTKPSEVGVIHAHLDEPPPPLPGKLGAGSRELSRVLARGLAKRPQDRPETASAFTAEVERAVARLSSAERSRRPAFRAPADAPRPAMSVVTPSSAETEFVGRPERADGPGGDHAAAGGGVGRAETIDLTRAPGLPGRTPAGGATIHDRQSRLVPRPDAAPARLRPAWLRRPLPIAGLVVLLLAVALGAFFGLRGPSEQQVAVGPVTFDVPADWTQGAVRDDTFAGLPVGQGSGIWGGNGPGGATVAVAPLRASASLLPSGADEPPKQVEAGGGIGYAWTVSANGGSQRLIVVPAAGGKDAGGTVTVSCAGNDSGGDPCGGVLSSLGGQAGSLTSGAAAAEVKGIAAALTPLRKARATPLPRGEAKRAAAASSLERAHAAATKALRALAAKNVWDADLAALATQTNAVGRQYGRITDAARANDRAKQTSGDAQARDRLATADRKLRRALTALIARQPRSADPALRTLRAAALTSLSLPPKRAKKKVAKTSSSASAATSATPSATTSSSSTASAAPRQSSAPKSSSSSKSKSSSSKKKAAPIVVAPPSDTE